MANMSDNESSTPSVTIPFALVGLVGGGLVATVYYPDGEAILGYMAALVVLFTPFTAGTLGAWLSSRLRGEAFGTYSAVVFGTLVAGAINGFLAGLPVIPFNFVFGPIVGVLCALPFLPPLVLVVMAARRAGEARKGSLAHSIRQRSPYLVVAASAAFGGALGASMVVRDDQRWPMPFALFCLVGAALATPLLMLDVVSLWRARNIEKAFLSARPLSNEESQKAIEIGANLTDFGLGSEALAHLATPATAYRDGAHVSHVLKGSRRAFVRTALFAIACELLVIASGTALFATGVASREVSAAPEWPTSNALD